MQLMKNKKVVLGGGIAAVLIIIIVAVIISKQPKKINVEDYVEITYRGFNGYASANVTLDKEGLYNAVLEATGRESANNDSGFLKALSSAMQEDLKTIRECINQIELTPSQESNLSNGDTITVEITYDNEMVKKQKIKFTGSTVTLKVEDLEDAIPVNPFDGLEVSFYGTSPNGGIQYSYNGTDSHVSPYSFSAEPSYDLKNGDVVTITYSFNAMEAQTGGYAITKTQMEYEVSGLDEYIQSYADLTEEFLEHMKSEAKDKITSYSASSYYSSGINLNDTNYAGYILLTSKNGSENYLYVIYTGIASNTSGNFPATKVYYPVQFYNIMKKDGELSYSSMNDIQGSSSLGSYSTRGYVNPIICYNNIVVRNMEYYNSECGDGFEVFAEFEQITKLSDIADSYKNELYQNARDTIESYIARDYSSDSTASGLALAGEYLLVSKNPGYTENDFVNNNTYIVVYSAQVSNEKGYFETTTVYYPVAYKGIVSLPNGEYMVTQSGGIQGGRVNFPNSSYRTYGYIDGTLMYNELVATKVDRYTYEVSDGLKQFGQ